MNIYKKIESTHLTEIEKYFINQISEHIQELYDLNVQQLAKETNVSLSTIYRVIDKLNLSGINELKLKLYKDHQNYHKEKEVDYNYPFDKNNTHHQIMNKMFTLYQQTLQSTLNLIDLETFLKVEQSLYNAHQIIIFPTIGNYFMAESFQQNMLEIGVKIDVIVDRYYQHWNISALNQDDIVILISYANRTPYFVDLAKRLKKRKIKTVLISSTQKTELSQYCDYHLYFSSYEDSEEKIASFSSRISLQYLLDCLYAAYFNRNYEKHLHHKINNYID